MLNIPSSTLLYDSFRMIFLYTLSNGLPNLEQLILLGRDKIRGDDVLRFLQACFQHRRLMTLKCWFTLQRTPPMGNFTLKILLGAMGVINNGTVNNPASDHPGPPRIKDFRLPRFMEEYPVQKFLVPLLKHFGPGLERLGLSSPTDGDLDQLQRVCAENCSGLQHLATSYQGDLKKDMNISSVIRCFKRPSLKSLSMDGYPHLHDTRAILDALVDCHSHTVEQVDMLHCGATLDVLRRLFVECKKLKRLWVMDSPKGSVDNQIRYYFQDNANNYITGPTWQCLEMTELCIHLNLYQNGHGRVVGEIGRMIKLETLGIGYNDTDLLPIPERDQGPGCLAELRQLKNLKRLRHLLLMLEFWLSMGQAEVAGP